MIRVVRGKTTGICDPDGVCAALNGVSESAEAVLDNVPNNPAAVAYRAGFRNAISATAAVFGLVVLPDARPARSHGDRAGM